MSSRYKISEPLLDSEYDKIKVETVATIAPSNSVGLMCDGWSNIRNKPIINFVVGQLKLIFWKSFHNNLQSHTGEYIATEILKVIEELESECGKMVFGVVTNYASNMKKAWPLIEEKYPTIICYGCAAHGLNLSFCDMIKLETCKNIIERAKGVIKEFKHKHMLVDILTLCGPIFFPKNFPTGPIFFLCQINSFPCSMVHSFQCDSLLHTQETSHAYLRFQHP